MNEMILDTGFWIMHPPASRIQYLASSMDHYFKIGKLAASFGLKGELILQHNLGKKTAFKGLESVFIEEKKESFLPYFIESVKVKSEDEVYLKLEGIDTVETARKMTPKEVWLTEADFKKFADK